LRTALHAARVIGSVGIITHPLDDGVRSFYTNTRLGFQELPFNPLRAMLVRMVDLQRGFAPDISNSEPHVK
jgi:hypothetical protein